jgi:hypothetical protein
VDALERELAAGADIDERDLFGISRLEWVALMGHAEAARLLLDRGAEVNAKNKDGSTALHSAAFLGRAEVAKVLVEAGADAGIKNAFGQTPLGSAGTDWGIVEAIAGSLEIDVDKDEVMAGRNEVVALLGGIEGGGQTAWGVMVMIVAIGAFIPVFHHLWFLYYLCWLLALFVGAAALFRKLGCKPISDRWITSHWRWLWLFPATLIPQLFMGQTFGPDTATGLVPWPPKLAYYAVFFGFGALCFGRGELEGEPGRGWVLCFALAIQALIGGLYFWGTPESEFALQRPIACAFMVAYAWLMIFGFAGFFRRFFSGNNARIRYLSDASYWLYLAHLPPILILQIIVSDWEWPGYAKFALVCIVPTALLLVIYEFAVRYTFVGTMLNGKKYRTTGKGAPGPPALPG